MTPFNPDEAATTPTDPLMMAVKWYSGTERLDMHEIANALEAYTPGANVTVQTTELREEEFCEVLYEPTIAPSSLSPGAFTLTYTDGGVWLDDTDELPTADGDHGTATYQQTIDKDGKTTWSCAWEGFDEKPVRAAPTCTLSDAVTSREYGVHTRAVRDTKFRKLILQDNPKCLITGETDTRVLDAAHIHEVRHGGKDVFENGIVLRTDLHKLFDEHILTLDTKGNFVMEPMLASYKDLFKKPQAIPQRKVKFYRENIAARNAAKDKKTNTTEEKQTGHLTW
jgi:hypothetical protein